MPIPKLKYEPLERYLRQVPKNRTEVQLSFKEIEEVIGATLPASSWTYREWWSNQKDTKTRPQAQAWLSAGFLVDFVKQSKDSGSVRFKRK